MKSPADFIGEVGKLLEDLSRLGYPVTLVGGMAMVTLGSTRVTKDFDFLISELSREEKSLIGVFYNHGFELVSKIDKAGNIVRTIDNQNVASARLRIDKPKSAYFFNSSIHLRIDLLFDFPIQARDVFARSTRKKIESYVFHIADKKDLIKMKEIAAADRKLATDIQDLEFLKKI